MITVQHFAPGHKYYTDKLIKNDKAQDGVVGTFGSVFGQMLIDGKFFCYTMERKDTLIAEGEYDVTYHDSPSNHCVCPHIWSATCAKERYILIHKANWAYQLKGCTAVGMGISTGTPMLMQSGTAFDALTKLLKFKPTKIKYETLKQTII